MSHDPWSRTLPARQSNETWNHIFDLVTLTFDPWPERLPERWSNETWNYLFLPDLGLSWSFFMFIFWPNFMNLSWTVAEIRFFSSNLHRWTDRQEATHKCPPCPITGGLKNWNLWWSINIQLRCCHRQPISAVFFLLSKSTGGAWTRLTHKTSKQRHYHTVFPWSKPFFMYLHCHTTRTILVELHVGRKSKLELKLPYPGQIWAELPKNNIKVKHERVT